MDIKLDTTKVFKNKKNEKGRLLPPNFQKLREEFDLQDVWRLKNPDSRDYTFYSGRCKSWARIDMIWVSNSLCTKIDKTDILPRNKSDHSPITMLINYKKTIKKWRFDDNLLKKEMDIIKNKKLTNEFFEFNWQSETRIQVTWDAYKAVIRGYLIQQKIEKNKVKFQKLNEINKEITQIENELKKCPQKLSLEKRRITLINNKKNLELDHTATQLKFIKHYNFENANKPGAWLARKVRKKRQKQLITKIIDDNIAYLCDEEILGKFREFYTKLYKKEETKLDDISEYLNTLKLQKISDSQREYLNKDITEKEIRNAIKSMKPNKAPGPDGFTLSFYRVLEEELVPFLVKIMNAALKDKIIPESWTKAEVIAIPKDSADTTDVRNYRPISLLNIDYKLFTTILANRLKTFLENWIGREQNGFLPGRQLQDNVRCILDVIEYYEFNHQREVALLAIDAEKAFDNLNWNFFKLLGRELDLGYNFMNAIEAIYNKQSARVIINGHQSEEFNIEKGTRQGCPLSSLIFIFAVDILIRNIRRDEQLKGLKIKKEEVKIRAFADDLICVIEEPKNNLNIWLKEIEKFGKVAGFYINKEKTKILTKNVTKKNKELIQEKSGIKVTSKIRYLGIWITAKNAQLLENNYLSKWQEIRKDLQQWQHLKISLLGRISLVKMNVLPKLLYLFQNLPIIRNQKLFKEWKRDISKFIWKNKKPRINFTIMKDSPKRGGFGLPDFQLYFEACALQWIKEWVTLEKEDLLNLEDFDLRRGWHAYLGYDKRSIEKNFGNHFIRSALIKIWEKYKVQFYYNKLPLWISTLEANQRKLLGWSVWPTYKDVLTRIQGTYELKPKEEIKQKFPNMSWFQYAQIKEQFSKDKINGFGSLNNAWDKIISLKGKMISRIYTIVLEGSTQMVGIKNCMVKWARNIGRPIRLEEWETIWNKKLKYTYASDLKENWYKIFHRWYITPKKLGKMYKNYDNKCWKCKTQIGSFYHTWWTCDKTKKFWKMIHAEIQTILDKQFPLKPEYYLLGIMGHKLEF
uniref:Reverse transcriptase domain-containing protein n=1 Tax=Anolis carolinensis TaxID=28377 RepID=A0A803T6S0_ANOCA